MRWIPQPIWKGQDACIIGGGSSLQDFPFERLKGRNVIGCNDAFRLGKDIVSYVIFGDTNFFHRNKFDLEKHKGPVVTCATALLDLKLDWLLAMPRVRDGLHSGPVLGWNYSTGAAAVNLAISLGAIRIFLLGFDMGRRQDGRTHWHAHGAKAIQDESYRRFLKGFSFIQRDLAKYPEVKIFNVTDGSSKLQFFPRMGFQVFWRYIPPHRRAAVPCYKCEERAQEAVKRMQTA